ncbi:MAG: GFA family protein [Parasphingopyxis sp.]|uniref:GFA family protein n=1 Tax=Parasphingopyxis sp. TaxID=1920299 RepID=UPI0032EFE20D
MSQPTTITGGCHCGDVRFSATVREPRPQVLDCNCSICAKTGFLHLFIPHGDFTLLTDRNALASYRFGSGAAEHLFCRRCGIKSFYQPRSHPDCWSVNLRALDEGHGLDVDVVPFDGHDWESAKAGLA